MNQGNTVRFAQPNFPPGPRTPAAWQLARYSGSSLTYLEQNARRYGDPFTLRLAGYGTLVVHSAPEAVKEIFRADRETLYSGEGNEFLSLAVGEHSVLVLDGDAHTRQRRVLLPPLKGERMRAFFNAMQAATLEFAGQWRPGQQCRMLEPMQEITLRVMLRVVLGIDSQTTLAKLAHLVRRVLALGRGRHGLILVQALPVRMLQRNRLLPFYRRMHALDVELFALIAACRATPPGARGETVLADLLEATHDDGRPLADIEVRDALVKLIFAGHETTSVALAWFLEQVVPMPDVADLIREELLRVTGGGPPQPEQLNQLAYLDASIRESLRRRTILPFVVRKVKKPFAVQGIEYPAGTVLCPSGHLTHHREDLYPDPLLFRPERFIERRYSAHEWYPFGGGHRMCLGMAFALYEMKVVLATLFATVRLARPAQALSRPVRSGIVLAPDDGVVMEICRS